MLADLYIPLGAIGVSLNKQKLMYNILAPSIIAIYKFLCTPCIYVYICKLRPKGYKTPLIFLVGLVES